MKYTTEHTESVCEIESPVRWRSLTALYSKKYIQLLASI